MWTPPESPYKRKCWTISGGPLVTSLLWGQNSPPSFPYLISTLPPPCTASPSLFSTHSLSFYHLLPIKHHLPSSSLSSLSAFLFFAAPSLFSTLFLFEGHLPASALSPLSASLFPFSILLPSASSSPFSTRSTFRIPSVSPRICTSKSLFFIFVDCVQALPDHLANLITNIEGSRFIQECRTFSWSIL